MMSSEQARATAPVGDGYAERSAVGSTQETVSRSVENVQEVRDLEVPDDFDLQHNRVYWGPIIAGLLTALTALILLSLLGLAIGLTTVNAGAAAVQGSPPVDAGRNSGIWAGIAGVISFILGGYVAGRTAAVFDRRWGALNGALVFMLAVPLVLWLAGQGLGAALGSLGNVSGALASNPNVAQTAQGVAGQAQAAAQGVQPIDVARAAEGARNTAWGALAGLIVALGSSALGGYFGTRHLTAITHRTTRVVR